MKNFVLIYYNEEAMTGPPDPKRMEAWNKWFGDLGKNLVDGGNPFNSNGMAVEKSGVSKIENYPSTGYSIIKAETMDDAVEITKNCPLLQVKGAAIRVYETLPM